MHEIAPAMSTAVCSSLTDADISCQGPILQTWPNLNPSMDKQLIHHKVWGEITYPFPNRWVIPSHTFLGMWLLIHAGIKVDPC